MSRRRPKPPKRAKPTPRAKVHVKHGTWRRLVARMKRLAREAADPREREAARRWLENLAPAEAADEEAKDGDCAD